MSCLVNYVPVSVTVVHHTKQGLGLIASMCLQLCLDQLCSLSVISAAIRGAPLL